MASESIFYYDQVTPEFLKLRKKIQTIFDKNFKISKDLINSPNFSKKDFKNISEIQFYKFHKKDDKFFKQKFPLDSSGETIEKIMVDDLYFKINFPKDY